MEVISLIMISSVSGSYPKALERASFTILFSRVARPILLSLTNFSLRASYKTKTQSSGMWTSSLKH
jgi:hypothetical protein